MKKEISKSELEKKALHWLNIISISLFLLSSFGLGVSFFLKHVHLMIFSLIIIIGLAYLLKRINIDYKTESQQK